jgi:predicted metal-dependent phosphoesterase TrpH
MASIDLHVHTTASDGRQAPTEVVEDALARGLSMLGIADHDTTGGVREAVQGAHGTSLTLVPGVELSVGAEEYEIHILGYFVDSDDHPLQTVLSRVRGARDTRNERIAARLKEIGVPVELARVKEIGGDGSVGRPHIAAALVEAGHVGSIGEAFGRYLARGKPGYVGRERLGPAEAAAAIRNAGGLPVLAHPAKIGPRQIIEGLLDQGMEGIEVYHSDHSEEDSRLLLALARDRDLLVTGGSDSHGRHANRPILLGSVEIPDWVGPQFLARAPEAWTAAR